MKIRQDTRGRPVIALLAVLGAWVVARLLLWDVTAFAPAFGSNEAEPPKGLVAVSDETNQDAAAEDERSGALAGPWPDQRYSVPAAPPHWIVADQIASMGYPRQVIRIYQYFPVKYVPAPAEYAQMALASYSPPSAVPQPLFMAAAQQFPQPSALPVPMPFGFAMPGPEAAASPAARYDPITVRRWSGDSWLLLRQGANAALAAGGAPATYGASQMGGVLRYRLGLDSRHRPAAYLRTTTALNGSGEREIALGLSARPLAGLPVTAMAELRATAQPGGTRLRPAATVVTELPPIGLPHRLRAEVYAQAGYVGGRYATPFADGQVRVDRGVANLGRAEVRAGAGAWGGAQKGASRLDVGPTATMGMGLGRSASARLGLDWRFRVAGDAAPSSGPALTLSAGF